MKLNNKFQTIIGVCSALAAISIPVAAEPIASQNPARDAVQSVLQSPNSVLPSTTEIRGIAVQNGLATVNFNSALVTDFKGGDTDEAKGVNAILKALGKFPNVSKVQILVNGEHVDSLGGLLDISGPLPVIRETKWLAHRTLPAKSLRLAQR
ncbi:MAG: GerMN domain-containing protein [Capsulimonas sp.]|uniref:GerMN domain-containing protein n=1 Tax=Capsulimonas sp. TaxID=2494211 RepID=UPI003263898B